jgi:hypothetical protein
LQRNSVDITASSLSTESNSEVGKENVVIHHINRESMINEEESQESINITVDLNAGERNRIKKYSDKSLNIASNFDVSAFNNKLLKYVENNQNDQVLSPRKTIFLNKSSNTVVVVQDKVYSAPGKND